MKKLFILTLLFACSLVVQAQTFFTIDGVRYMLENDHAVVARQDRELIGDINIPATVTYGDIEYNVTRLMSPDDGESGGGGAFQECEITSITLPESITDIPRITFHRCMQLSNVNLLGPVTSIGEHAFENCEALTSIVLPESVTEMGDAAFQGTNLTAFKIPAGVTTLNGLVLADTRIIDLEIPASVNYIGLSCFSTYKTDDQGEPLRMTVKMFQRDCRNIECDMSAFSDLTTVDLLVPAGGKVVYQEYLPWMYMNSITEYGEDTGEPLVPDQRHVTIDDIRYLLKNGETNEAYVDIQPETLSGEVIIPEKVTYDDTEYTVTTIMGEFWNELDGFHECGAFTKTQVTKVTLPTSIKTINHFAFKETLYLQEVVLNEGLIEIGTAAFRNCPELTTINIPSTVTTLPGGMFEGCSKLTSLTFEEGFESLQSKALYNLVLETLTIPSTCTFIDHGSLFLPNLKTLYLNVKEPSDLLAFVTAFGDDWWDIEGGRNNLKNVDLIVPLGCAESYKMLAPWIYCRSITEEGNEYYQPKKMGVNIDGINYVLQETVNEENETVRTATIACQNFNLSGDITIPTKVSYAKKVLQGDEWVALETYDYDVTDIVSANVGENQSPGIHHSDGGAFQECQITSISLPSTITTIPAGAFKGCQQLKNVTLPEGITTIGAGAFAHCINLEEIYLPETITDMNGWYIFGNCPNLKKVNIPKLVTSLGNGCFADSGIETFIIPENVVSIGEACFGITQVWYTYELKCIKICHESYTDGSISFPENMFTDISGITLIVPEGTKESLYSQVYPWKDFDNIIEYQDQHDEHQYNNYRVEFEEEADEEEEPDDEEETPAASRSHLKKTEAFDEPVTAGFTPSGVAPELPTEIEKNGKKYAVTYKEPLAVMPASDVVLKVALARIGAGDVNGDGKVDADDITEIVKYIMYPWDGFNIGAADANDDGVVNIADIIYILNGN